MFINAYTLSTDWNAGTKQIGVYDEDTVDIALIPASAVATTQTYRQYYSNGGTFTPGGASPTPGQYTKPVIMSVPSDPNYQIDKDARVIALKSSGFPLENPPAASILPFPPQPAIDDGGEITVDSTPANPLLQPSTVPISNPGPVVAPVVTVVTPNIVPGVIIPPVQQPVTDIVPTRVITNPSPSPVSVAPVVAPVVTPAPAPTPTIDTPSPIQVVGTGISPIPTPDIVPPVVPLDPAEFAPLSAQTQTQTPPSNVTTNPVVAPVVAPVVTPVSNPVVTPQQTVTQTPASSVPSGGTPDTTVVAPVVNSTGSTDTSSTSTGLSSNEKIGIAAAIGAGLLLFLK